MASTWLSDICKGSEQLKVDLLIGTSYLQAFQTGYVVQGKKVDDPVKVETALSWVTSGPLRYSQSADGGAEVQGNFIGSNSVKPQSLERGVYSLWD